MFSNYLRHRAEVEAYLAEQEHEGAGMRARREQMYPMPEVPWPSLALHA